MTMASTKGASAADRAENPENSRVIPTIWPSAATEAGAAYLHLAFPRTAPEPAGLERPANEE